MSKVGGSKTAYSRGNCFKWKCEIYGIETGAASLADQVIGNVSESLLRLVPFFYLILTNNLIEVIIIIQHIITSFVTHVQHNICFTLNLF